MLFYLLLPLAVAVSGKVPMTFWQTLHVNLSSAILVSSGIFLSRGHCGKCWFYCRLKLI